MPFECDNPAFLENVEIHEIKRKEKLYTFKVCRLIHRYLDFRIEKRTNYLLIKVSTVCYLGNKARVFVFVAETHRLFYFKLHFSTEEVILQPLREQVLYFYSTSATKYTYFFPVRKNAVCWSVTSFLHKTAGKAVLCNTFVIFKMQVF